MENVTANFTVGQNNSINTNYTVSAGQQIETSYTVTNNQPIQTEFTLEDYPTKLSQLEIDRSMPTFVYEQAVASDTWLINHNMNKKPSITIVDSAENVVIGSETYIDENTVEIKFNGEFSGKAYLN